MCRGLPTCPQEYYWGVPDANVIWCEPKYNVSYYISEFFNTISSITMALALLGIVVHWKRNELIDHLCYVSLGFVGVGSILFHGTSRHWAEFLDEIPMLFFICFLICSGRLLLKKSKQLRGVYDSNEYLFMGAIVTVTSIASLAYIVTDDHRIFSATFMFLMVTAQLTISAVRPLNPCELGGILSFWNWYSPFFLALPGGACWLIERVWFAANASPEGQVTCPLPILLCHPLWHILVGLGGYWYIGKITDARVAIKRLKHLKAVTTAVVRFKRKAPVKPHGD